MFYTEFSNTTKVIEGNVCQKHGVGKLTYP